MSETLSKPLPCGCSTVLVRRAGRESVAWEPPIGRCSDDPKDWPERARAEYAEAVNNHGFIEVERPAEWREVHDIACVYGQRDFSAPVTIGLRHR